MSVISTMIRECVQDLSTSNRFGEWGALSPDQRRKIRHLCDTCDAFERTADYYVSEINRLNGELTEERTRRENAVNAYHEAKEEIESLKRQLHNSKLHEKECYEARRVLSMGIDHDRVMIRAEAIKEFAERLKKYEGRRGVPVATIDNLVKEMVGDAE